MLRLSRNKIARIFAAVALTVAAYALAGFVIAPKIVRNRLLEDIPKTLSVTPSVGEIRINPFLLRAEIKDFALAGKGSPGLVGFRRLYIEFELSSLWHRAYSFGRIEIAAPYVSAAVAADGTLNLLQLRPKATSPTAEVPAAKSNGLPAIRVASFKVSQGSVSYEDRSRPSEFTALLTPINFELKDFTTGVAGGLFTFTGTSKLGERVEWHGHLSVQPFESDGELRIDGLHARTLWEYLEDRLNFAINSGSIDVQASYKFALKDTVDLALEVANATVKDLAVRPKEADTDWLSVPLASLRGAKMNLAQRSAEVESLSLSGVKVSTWLEPDGSVNLLELVAPKPPVAAAKAQAVPTLVASNVPQPTATSWRFDLREFDLNDATILAEDRTVQPAVKVMLAPLSLKVSGASLDLSKPVKVALDTRINAVGSLAVNGEITPDPVSAVLDLKLSGIDLALFQPYVAQHTSMTLRSGRIGGEGQVHYGAKQSPRAAFNGDLHVENLQTVDEARHDEFIDWERLDVRGVNFRQAPDRLDIAEIEAVKPYVRAIIESDASLNVTHVLKGPSVPAPAAAANANAPASAAPAKAAMRMSIKRFIVHGGRANFTDLSVAPNFSAGIQSLEGSVLGLSSNPNSRAKVDLHGSVDEFSPVAITGELNILSAALYTDLAMDFRNIELTIFNPYSDKFAGYHITKGKLTAEMRYKVEGRKLDAQHHIIIDQLEFGDKTASRDAVSLPVKLAVALLKDRNGVIDLPLPVSGSLDDPKFRVGPIIWKILVNILEKAVTAPFALLGSLFGGGPDLQFIDFQPGSSRLDASQAEKIKAIVKALEERPQLKIEVPIAALPDVDRPALAAAALDAQLGDSARLDPRAKLELLTQLYVKNLGSAPQFPESVVVLKQKPELVSAKIEFLAAALRAQVTVGDEELKALGQQRALVLQQAMLTDTQVAPDRVFLVANDKAAHKDGAVRLELSLR